MSSITNINNNSAVINVGRTTPVSPGITTSDKSIPVVVASDQPAIPVEEQNKIQSEVALSLLGIPRAEVALGIFADVNTYDVNPTEWSSFPQSYTLARNDIGDNLGFGTKHLHEEAGALVEAPRNKTAVLTSKRFFRYQPGRVSAATFGIKTTISDRNFSKNPVIRKYGIYDKYDGYYWENTENGQGDNFVVVRRTQSLFRSPVSPFGIGGTGDQVMQLRGMVDTNGNPVNEAGTLRGTTDLSVTQLDDYRVIGKAPANPIVEDSTNIRERKKLNEIRFDLAEEAIQHAITNQTGFAAYYNGLSAENQEKCYRDADYWIMMILEDMALNDDLTLTSRINPHVILNQRNYETSLAVSTRDGSRELQLYQSLKAVVSDPAGLVAGDANSFSSDVVSLIEDLVDDIIAFWTRVGDATTYPSTDPVTYDTATNTAITDTIYRYPNSWGDKPRVETLFDTRKYYWSYYVAEKDNLGNTITYDDTLVPAGFTLEDIKYKCQRDVLYVLDGYKNDLSGGGNAETKYNASMYYRGDGMSIFTQRDANGVATEYTRHTHLQNLIEDDINNSEGYFNTNLTSNSTKFTELSDLIINNFVEEDDGSTEYGTKPLAGNLVTLRDGLIMVHAAVNDPSLLKPIVPKKARYQIASNSFKLNDGIVTFGQHIRFVGEEIANNALVNGRIYKVNKVYGPKGNEFTLYDEVTQSDVTLAGMDSNDPKDTYFELVVPFIFPDIYDPTVYTDGTKYDEVGLRNFNSDVFGGGDPYPQGMMFPLLYSNEEVLPLSDGESAVGYVDTALPTDVPANARALRTQIDNVNFIPEYINWIKNNVDPEFYGVYEYRVPRSRFSTDKLNGLPNIESSLTNKLVYSDIATGNTGKVRPGQPVRDGNGIQIEDSSVYNYDFTKVTMLKIEFSWYGAVGALFLAYVPVSNGEARWVRVHHLRASNQLKISSLGNATLPITYTVYGGGDEDSLGYEDRIPKGYDQSVSHHLVKYGASYYIDGGDRGTVRLYSHTAPSVRDVFKRRYVLGAPTYLTDTELGMSYISRTPGAGQPPNEFFMGGSLVTNVNADRIVKVAWVTDSRIYFDKLPTGTQTLSIIVDRSTSVFGLETKREIISSQKQKVRNRVQVYPTKLSTANINTTNETIRLNMKKSPIYQTNFVEPAGVPEFVIGKADDGDNYIVSPENNRLPVLAASQDFMIDGESAYGWFRGTVLQNAILDNVTLFGRLYKLGNDYYFENLDNFAGEVRIKGYSTGTPNSGKFLRDPRMTGSGILIGADEQTKFTLEKEGLSSILVASDDQVPIPGTGSSVSTLYIGPGADQFDLSDYYDYNKEYLSFPLTDQADTLYFTLDSDKEVDLTDVGYDIESSAVIAQGNIGVTWEEQ